MGQAQGGQGGGQRPERDPEKEKAEKERRKKAYEARARVRSLVSNARAPITPPRRTPARARAAPGTTPRPPQSKECRRPAKQCHANHQNLPQQPELLLDHDSEKGAGQRRVCGALGGGSAHC